MERFDQDEHRLNKAYKLFLINGIKCLHEIGNLMWTDIPVPGDVLQYVTGVVASKACRRLQLDCVNFLHNWQTHNGINMHKTECF